MSLMINWNTWLELLAVQREPCLSHIWAFLLESQSQGLGLPAHGEQSFFCLALPGALVAIR